LACAASCTSLPASMARRADLILSPIPHILQDGQKAATSYRAMTELLELGANPNVLDSVEEMSPLMHAIRNCDIKAVRILAEHPSTDLEVGEEAGKGDVTPQHHSIRCHADPAYAKPNAHTWNIDMRIAFTSPMHRCRYNSNHTIARAQFKHTRVI